jgi:hypothetical protein
VRTVKPARPQQLQAVLRTPGGTAVVVFGILEMVLQEKSSLNGTILREACGYHETRRKDRHVSLECNRTKEVI